MKKFGICMEGCEAGFEAVIREAWERSESLFFRYLEIGVAGGETLRAVTDICRELCPSRTGQQVGRDAQFAPRIDRRWVTVGVDLGPEEGAALGYGYALNAEGLKAGWPELVLAGRACGRRSAASLPENAERTVPALEYGRPHLVLGRSVEVLRIWPLKWGLDVVFVDGCHGRACVKADFAGVAEHVVPGGVVIFHDAGELEQGRHPQPHCGGEGIAVREALREMGLLPESGSEPDRPSGEVRRGAGEVRNGFGHWRFVREIAGDPARGGHSCVVVRRIN